MEWAYENIYSTKKLLKFKLIINIIISDWHLHKNKMMFLVEPLYLSIDIYASIGAIYSTMVDITQHLLKVK